MGKQYFITIQLLTITGILSMILVSMLAFRFYSLPRSQAGLSDEQALSIPYLRLEQTATDDLARPEQGRRVTVKVLVNTGGSNLTGADVVLKYDPLILRLTEDAITTTDAFEVMQVNSLNPGLADFSVFSSSVRDETQVVTNADQEIAIAEVQFAIINPDLALAQIEVVYTPGELADTNLILSQEPRPEFPTDILQSVRGVTISL